MKKLILLSSLVSGMAQANFCPQATPLMKQYQSQKNWVKKEVSEPGVQLKIKGYVDSDNNFFIEEDVARVEQGAKLSIDPLNNDSGAFKTFCSDYENNGDILTAFRESNGGNKYHLNLRYLPKLSGFMNDPFHGIKTHRFKVSVEVSPDSLIGRLSRKQELQQEIVREIEAQLNEGTPVGSYNLTLTNWDDFACDLVQGKAQLGISREMYSEDAFVTMNEVISDLDVKQIYREWRSQLQSVKNRDELMFTAGMVLQTLQNNGTVSEVSTNTALKMMTQFYQPGKTGLSLLADQELACLSDSLQDYDREYTQYKYNVFFKVNKSESLGQGE